MIKLKKLAILILIIEVIFLFYPISSVKIEKSSKEKDYLYKKDIVKTINLNSTEYTNNTNYNEEYKEEISTIYDYFTENELKVLFNVVQAEIGCGTFESKLNVVSVIFNRYYIEREQKDVNLINVLEKNSNGVYQFSVVADNRYKFVEPDEDTILACEYVFDIGSTTDAIWFNTKGLNSWASRNREFVMCDEYHDFYK